ncbi:glycopeptide antibiotics resistance protein [Microbacterium sp. W4I4]|uniref:VanZ family protein n=1 Tax=Microbacterium sp. W4I4 TaxID=3042295 RepID=UPI00277E9B08|nr:VanZ family protein [Microbacterium sp. W4I4]MDQ0613779.1 glycopeptide antibiotics resistance protein [Microbacterium sp. W4I4]
MPTSAPPNWVPEPMEGREPVEGPVYMWAPPAPRRRPHFRLLPNVLLLPYAIALFLITWLPASQAGKVTGIVAYIAHYLDPRIPFSVGYPVLEFLANIALFVPLGLLLSAGWPRVPGWVVILIGFATTVTIECVQWGIPSRFPAISDIVSNTLGTIIGVALVALVTAFAPRRSNLVR